MRQGGVMANVEEGWRKLTIERIDHADVVIYNPKSDAVHMRTSLNSLVDDRVSDWIDASGFNSKGDYVIRTLLRKQIIGLCVESIKALPWQVDPE